MHKFQRLICCILLSVLCYTPVFSQAKQTEPRQGLLRIKLEPEMVESLTQKFSTRSGVLRTGKVQLDEANRKVKATRMERMFPYAPKFEEKMRKHGLNLWYEVHYDDDMAPVQAASVYKAIKGVQIADVVRPMVLMDGSGGVVKAPEMTEIVRDDYAPFNDPFLNRQWHYNNNGQLEGWKVGADINLYQAWKTTAGSPDVIVAIIDGGIDYMHEDLKDNIWVNEAELNGTPGVDDDGNGYVDDTYGWNWVRNSDLVYPHDHGTHVAGTVAAVNNNGIGVGGVAGGSGNKDGVKLMSCQIFDQMEANIDFSKAIVYAANAGAVIAQCSWGWNVPDLKEQAVLDAIDYFTEEARGPRIKGGLCIFATGNLGVQGDFYPSAYEPVVAVGAMRADYTVANYTNNGKTLDVIAPGGDVEFDGRMGVYSTTPRNQYGWMDGTSMATPHVSGIAALILSKYGHENFTVKELRDRLETGVRDIYAYNPTWKGRAGVGFVDAGMALSVKGDKAPEDIAGIEVFPAQQEAGVQWKIPNDADDHFVHHHVIYWSNKIFDAKTNLSTLNSKIIDTKFLMPGTQLLQEIDGLQAETEYWFAVKAFDRWGNASALSPVVAGKTNAGPVVELDRETMNINVDVSTDYIVTDLLQLINSGEGLLKWNGVLKRKNDDYMGTALRTNRSVCTVPFRGTVKASVPQKYELVRSDFMAEDFPQTLRNHSSDTMDIGEVDETLTNSSAMYFKVDAEAFPAGFNLTHFSMNGIQGRGRYIVQLYSNTEALSEAVLLQSDTIPDMGYNKPVALSHDFYIAPGAGVWLVVHVPAGNYNPLGVGVEREKDYSQKCFYSSDMGKSWNLLETVLKEGGMNNIATIAVWSQTLISNQASLDGYLVLTPTEGRVSPSESGNLEVTTTRRDIVDGYYTFDLILNTNETGKEKKVIPVGVNVMGHKPEIHTAKVVNFGDVFVGLSKVMQVEVVNAGYGFFNVSEFISSDPQFEVGQEIWSFGARARSRLLITYKPGSAGNHVSTITLKDYNGMEYSFLVRGIAEEPGRISVSPENIAVGDLEYPEEPKELTIQISNTGHYPLEYVFPLFSNDTLTGVKKTSHKAGYYYISNLENPSGFTYEWPELTNATNIQKELTDGIYWSSPVELEFPFPFYGKQYDKIYIGSFGALSVTGGGAIHSTIPPTGNQVEDIGIISAIGIRALQFDKSSKLLYAHQDGKFIVSYENALMQTNMESFIRVTFRIVLCENGDMEIFYKDITPIFEEMWDMPVIPPGDLFVGCADVEDIDPFIITDQDMVMNNGSTIHLLFNQTQRAIKIVAPGKNMVQSIDIPSGIVNFGETKTIHLTVAADSTMSTGPLKNILTLLSTDPGRSTSYITLDADITGAYYKPFVELRSDELDFGTNFKTSVLQKGVTIKNTGKASTMITAIALKDNSVSFTAPVLPYELKAGSSVDVMITVPADTEGTVENELTVNADNGQTLTAVIKAKIIGVPDVTVDPVSFNITLEGGTTKAASLKISNPGTEPLMFAVQPHNYLYQTDPVATAKDDDVDYVYASSVNDEKVVYDWVDITKTATEHIRGDFFGYNDCVKVGLENKVTFYGKQFDSVYIYENGFLTFEQLPALGGQMVNPPLTVPHPGNQFGNYIAPLWSVSSFGFSSIAGLYYEEREEGFVVSYMDYVAGTNFGFCFQVIIAKEGRIKYQYKKLENSYFGRVFGLVGMENGDHTKGFRIPERYIGDQLAVEFYPVKTKTLAPNANVTVGMVADASDLLKGFYQEPLTISTNIPGREEMTIPVDLNVTGVARPEYPDSLDFGDVVYGNQFVAPLHFKIANAGNAAFTITEYKLKNGAAQLALLPVFDGGGIAPDGLMPDPSQEMIIGKKPQEFDLQILPFMLDGPVEIRDVIEITTDIPSVISIPVSANVVETPAMDINQGNIRFYASDNTMSLDSTFSISNADGAHKLSYQVEILYDGQTVIKTDANQASLVVPVNSVAPATRSLQKAMPASEEYIRELKYETLGQPINTMGNGGNYIPFVAVTVYTAPSDGFNIAAVECLANIRGVETGDIKAEIRVGDSYTAAKTIAQGTVHVADDRTEYRTIKLDEPVYINPNETFYLYLTFPLGAEYPLGFINAAENNISGRYYIFVEEQWIDLMAYQMTYGPVALVTRCMEKTAGEPWISVNDPGKGTVAKGSANPLTVHVNAATARFPKGNQATVKISGNALDKPEHHFWVNLDKNSAPVITQVTKKIEVSENSTAEVVFNVKDNEGDKFTVELTDADNITTHNLAGDVLTVTLKPYFGHTGDRSFTIKATDAYGYASLMVVKYYVTKVNRAPVVSLIPENRKVYLGEVLDGMDLTTVFSDPDNDTLRYVVTSSDEEVMKAFEKDGVLELPAKAKGEATITLKAYDPSGLFAETKFEADVLSAQKTDGSEKIMAYPNPVVYMLNVRCSAEVKGESLIRMYDTKGALVYFEKTIMDSDVLKSIDVSSYPAGVYILEIQYEGGKANTKVIKQ